jgi:hypothetical protein
MRIVGRTRIELVTVAIVAVALALGAAACNAQGSDAPSGDQPALDVGLDEAPVGLDPSSPRLVAADIAFDRHALDAPRESFVLVFENRDSAPHTIAIYRPSDTSRRQPLFRGRIIGQGTVWYPVPALQPGHYDFICDVHPIPEMTGTITVP